jgi:hypothetical protein
MTPPEHVSVAQPVSPAIQRMKRMLFQPFDLGKWIAIGFCAWLAQLGQRGFNVHFNSGRKYGNEMEHLRHLLEQARDYAAHNLYWLLPLAAALLLIGLVIWVLILWVSSRGRFMFLHCVALDKAEVAVPWRKFAREGNSLFWFRLVLGLLGFAVVLPLLAVMFVVGVRMIERGKAGPFGILELAGVGGLLFLIAVVLWVVKKLIVDFVVPIMFRRGCTCMQGWGVLLGLLAGNVGRFILYFLFSIVLALAIFVVVATAVLATCCLLGCLLIIPFVSTVLLLPIHAFRRSYSVYYLAQYGEEYDVFRPAPAAPAPT